MERWRDVQAETRLTDVLTTLQGHETSNHKPVLIYLVPYDVVRLRTGGGKRIAGIAKALSADFRVYILSLSPRARPLSMHEVEPDVWMLAIPCSEEVELTARDLAETCAGAASLFSIAEHAEGCLELNTILEHLSPVVRGWILASPFAWPAIQRFFRPESHALAYDVHDDLLMFLRMGLSCSNPERLAQAEQLEGEVLAAASVAAFCTNGDAAAVMLRHSDATLKSVVVPNGVEVKACHWSPPAQVQVLRKRMGLDRPVAVFAGANYHPNHEAVDEIVRKLAPAFPQVLFVVMGMHFAPYRSFGGAEPGENVVFTGPVDEPVKEAIFSLAELALAPMKSGTGSSLKIPDYIAHGKLVLGTPVGLRGFDAFTPLKSVLSSSDISDLLEQVLSELADDPDQFTADCKKAREQVAATLDWSMASRPIVDAMKQRTAEPGT